MPWSEDQSTARFKTWLGGNPRRKVSNELGMKTETPPYKVSGHLASNGVDTPELAW